MHFKNINLKYLQYLLDNNIFLNFIKGRGYFASKGKIIANRGEVGDCKNGQGPRTQLF